MNWLTALLAAREMGLALAASAASTASAARAGFDPASTLPWVVPLILVAPLVGYVIVLSSVPTRRGAVSVAQLVLAVMLASALVVGWARFRQAGAYKAAHQWINIPVAFTGDQRFQGFGIDLAFRIDHAVLSALVTVLVLFLACLTWHRVAGRGEQGQVRYQVNALLFALGAAGVLLSGDLAELLAFWMVAGLGTYLLLGHRWGTEGAGQRGRVALALPFLGDMALLAGVALLYSRFGTTSLDALYPALTTTPGVGLKSVTVAAVLLFGAVAVRAAIWPFTSWQTATVDAPAAAVGLVAGVWPVLAGELLLRMLPVIGAAGVQAPRIAGYTLGVAAVVGPMLGLVGFELRRSILLASSGAVALALLGVIYPQSSGVGFTTLLAIAASRTAMLLAGSAVLSAMRTADIRAMGGGWRRMPATSAALMASAGVLALGGLGAAMLRPPSIAWVAFALGQILVAAGALRVYFAVAHGPLRRRRAFEPARVREPATTVTGAALAAAGLGAVALILAFLTPWVGFVAAGGHAVAMGTDVLWLVVPLAGAAGGAVAFGAWKDRGLEVGARLGEWVGNLLILTGGLYDRFFARPGQRIVHAVEDVGVTAAESGVGRGLTRAGGLAALAERSVPWVPAVLGLAVALAVAFGLLSQGLH